MKHFLSALQWCAIMIAMSLAPPIAIADLYGLSASQTAIFVQNNVFMLGLASFLQGIFGHKMPINETPSGVWWSIFAVYAGLVGVIYATSFDALRALMGGLAFSGVFLIVVSSLGLVDKLMKLFTPTVTVVYILLLVFQLSGSFIQGMFGITATNSMVVPSTAVLSLLVLFLAFYLGRFKNIYLKQFSIIIALIVGWVIFFVLGKAPLAEKSDVLFSLPKIWIFGFPAFDLSSIITAIFVSLLILTNLVAALRLMEGVLKLENKKDSKLYFKTGFVSGINQLLSSTFSVVGPVPSSGAAGFVSQTNSFSVKIFLLGSIITMLVSFFPPVMNFIAALPVPIGYAITVVIFSNMFIMGIKEIERIKDNQINYFTIISISLIFGVGIMFLPSSSIKHFPPIAVSLLNNGLIIGSCMAMLLEQCFLYYKKKKSL